MIRRFLQNFFIGRNGFDSIAKLTWVLTFVALLLTFIPGPAGLVADVLTLILLLYTWWRVLSRNVYKRAEENRRYLERTSKLRGELRGMKMRFDQRKDYKFFKCPTCHTLLRVPRGKGRIQITCRKCGNRFTGKT